MATKLLYSVVVTVTLLSSVVLSQTPFDVIPKVSEAVKKNTERAGVEAFIRLWEFTRSNDGQSGLRNILEPKTILAPTSHAMATLIPQDASNPLYGEQAKALRQTIVKDHLLLDPIKTTNQDITKGDGVRSLTFSLKDVYIKKDTKGKIKVNDVSVREVLSLQDGTQLYVLEDVLFDNRREVNDIFLREFRSELEGPTGPPLNIQSVEGFFPSPQLGGPPGTPQFSGFLPIAPPAPPSLPPGINPPALPPVHLQARAPAPPTFEVRAPAPPTVKLQSRGPAIPSLLLEGRAQAPAPPQPAGPPSTLLRPLPPSKPSASLFVRAQEPPRQFFGAAPPAAPAVADDAIIFEEEDQGQRIKRQLNFPIPDGLRSRDETLKGESSDLILPPGDVSFISTLSSSRKGYYNFQSSSQQQVGSSSSGNNRPLSELSSIEQFATLFELSGSPDSNSIVSVLQETGLVTMLGLLETSGLLQHLTSGDKGSFILMAPTESAFASLSRQELFDLSHGIDLSYHVIPLRGQSTTEVNNDSTFETLLGPEIRFNVYDGLTYANGVPVTRGDLAFTYGTIQVVDDVLKPPVGDIRSVLVNTGHSVSRINTLITVVESFDQGVYTLLAPPDSAISSKGYSWPGLLMQRALGKSLLEKHMFQGTWYAEGLLEQRTMRSLAGTSVTFRRDLDGTLTANGIPLRNSNLPATNGVVHLIADVIPDSDLGYDPTAIPNPLTTQTESPPVFENFAFGEHIVPEVPVISGLYELPGRDPFQQFVSVNSAPATSPLVRQSGDSPSASQSLAKGATNAHSTSQDQISSLGLNNNPNRANSFLKIPSIPDNSKPSDRIPNLEFAEFFEYLDNYPGGNAPTLQAQIPGAEFVNNIVRPFPSGDHAIPKVTDGLSNYGPSISHNTVRTTFVTGAHSTPALGNIIKERPIASPDVFIVVDPTQNPVTEIDRPPIVESEIISLLELPEFKGKNSSDLSSSPVSSKLQDNVSSALNLPAAVVTEGPFVWMPEDVITNEERKQMNVVSLLNRLNLTKFAELLEISGLTRTLHFDGPWTVFAPSNKAIEAIPSEALKEMIEQPRFLRRVLSYHLAPGRFLSDKAFSPGVHLPTLHAGYTLVVSYYTDGPLARWVAGGSVITDLDENANNGVVHVLDQVLYAPYGDLVTTVSLSPLLTIFSEIIASDNDIKKYLSGPGPFTLFAPSDDSLRNLTLPTNSVNRRAWILSHVVEGTWYTAGFSNTWPLVSFTNDTLVTNVSSDADKVSVNDVHVTYADVTATNGVLHVIEAPLLSPT